MMEHETAAVGAFHADHLADEEHVVTGRVTRVMSAYQPGDAPVDQRDAEVPGAVGDAFEAIGVRS